MPTEATGIVAERENLKLGSTKRRRSNRKHHEIGSTRNHSTKERSEKMPTPASTDNPDQALEHLAELKAELDQHRQEVEHLTELLSMAEKAGAVLERDKSVAETRADDLEQQFTHLQKLHKRLLARYNKARIQHDAALTAMGWLSKRRYSRRSRPSQPSCQPGRS